MEYLCKGFLRESMSSERVPPTLRVTNEIATSNLPFGLILTSQNSSIELGLETRRAYSKETPRTAGGPEV